MKRLAIMQPYFLPYIGYFQLLAAVDKFVVLDDVNLIRRGWVNRNRLLLGGAAHTFTVPLCGASQNRLICEMELDESQDWRERLLRTFRHAYGKAPCYAQVWPLLERVVGYPAKRLDEYLLYSIREIANHLLLPTKIEGSSRIYGNTQLKAQDRILDICRQEGAEVYVNPIGGVDLYGRDSFRARGIELRFLRSRPLAYAQGKGEHVPWLSIIDVLMYNEPDVVRRYLGEADLV